MSRPGRTPRQAGSDLPDQVVAAEAADVQILSHIIADAFHDLPPARWLIPDKAARREIFPGYFRLYVEHAMASGVVQTTTDRAAAALWLPVGSSPPEPPGDYDAQLAAATGPWIDQFRAFDATLDQHHPAGTPHHHLAILAIRPDKQGQGTGSLLLRTYHQMLDGDHGGTPTYLEAADPRNCQFYLRHGYTLRPTAPFHLPEGGPPMWPMWREPQPKPTRQDEPAQ